MSPTRHEAVLIGPATAPLAALLSQVLPSVRVQDHRDLYAAVPDLIREPPDSVWLDSGDLADDDLGALRLLRRALPDCRLVLLAATPGRPLLAAAVALGCRVASHPLTVRAVTTALATPEEHARLEVQPALFAGLMDQLNNPLAALAGRLQLVSLALETGDARDVTENLGLAIDSAGRMRETIEKLDLLSGRRRPVLVSLPPFRLLGELAKEIRAPLRLPEGTSADLHVQADEGLLQIAFLGILQVLTDLADNGAGIHASLAGQPTPAETAILLIQLEDLVPLPCRADELLAPFRLNRHLRDPDLGLDLAVSATLIEVQGGTIRPCVDTGFLRGFEVELRRGGRD